MYRMHEIASFKRGIPRMKINYAMWMMEASGGTRVMCEIMNELSRRGHDVLITTRHNRLPFPMEAKINTVPYLRVASMGAMITNNIFKRSFSVDEMFLKIMAKNMPNCDINVAHSFIDALQIYRSGKGIPFHHMQHLEELVFPAPYDQKRAKEVAENLSIKKFVNSIWLRDQMKEKYGYELPIINPAIDHSIFFPRKSNRNTNKLRVLCFGKQTRWKGFPEALSAMKNVLEKKDNIEFIAYGAKRPNYNSNVPYNFIRFPSDDELAKLYSTSDLVICPSWYESFPLPPLEAMACRAPVITTRFGTEDYAFHEKNCLVVPPKDPKLLSDAILRLLEDNDLREDFKKEGVKTAMRFTWDKSVDKIEAVFKEALN